jgi:hypothetical protein
MPRGGRRPNSGRKKGSANRKSREIADAVVETGCSPLSYMLSVLGDENAAQQRRDEMAKSAAPFCHPRLGLVATTDGANGAGRIGTINILVVPRGGQFCPESGLIRYPNGMECPPPAFQPLEPTPMLELPSPVAVEPEPTPEPLPVEPVADDGKIAQLAAWRRRDDDPAA